MFIGKKDARPATKSSARKVMVLAPILLGAALLAPVGVAHAASPADAARPAVASQHTAARPCGTECKAGFRQGYRDGYKDCLTETSQSRSRRGFNEWARGYDMGYRRGFYACEN
ncbi:hypothetical protein [Streptosporangium sp. KLBMP 9127]|nr:hypothetical protein [Streptosporangium sp. KLBMP 9127]